MSGAPTSPAAGAAGAPTLVRRRLSLAAVASALLALFPLTGVPAMVVGLYGLRAINAADGRLRGRRLAVAGMALGAAGTALLAAGMVLMVVFHLGAVSHRAGCENHLRQIGMSINRYADAHNGELPPGTVPNPALGPGRRLSWMAGILPFMTEGAPAGAKPAPPMKWQELVTKLDAGQGWEAPANAEARTTNVPAFLCPALERPDPRKEPGLTTYVGLAGVGPDAAALPKDDPRAGVFGYDRVIKRQDVRAGISFTTMVAETTRDLGPWVAGGPATVRGLAPDEAHYVGPGRPFGGLHPAGANVLRVDTSVHFIRDTVSPATFRSQATLAGAEGPGD